MKQRDTFDAVGYFVFIHNDSVAIALCSIFGSYWGIATLIIEGSSDSSCWVMRMGQMIWHLFYIVPLIAYTGTSMMWEMLSVVPFLRELGGDL